MPPMRRRVLRLLAIVVLSSPLVSSNRPSVSSGEALQFAPLISVGPHVARSTIASGGGVIPGLNIHYYEPSDITAAYGVDTVHANGVRGHGETIVIVDAYGSPTALADLQQFSSDFGLPAPNLKIEYPCGRPTFNNAMQGEPEGWAFETSLDLQWAHAIAPEADLVLVASNPSETQGVQGFPCIFNGLQWAVEHYPGAVISQSFAVTEQSFRSAAPVQVDKYRATYQAAVANRITVLGSSGDSGSANVDKQSRFFPFPTVNWPSSDPLVTSAGGTWLQYGWKWNPTISADDFYSCLNTAPDATPCYGAYLHDAASGTTTEAVWKEDWLPAATGGGRSALFSTPAFQSALSAGVLQGTRGLPDLSWNAAVDGAVLVYIGFLGGQDNGYYLIGGTSASCPQLAAVVALANQVRHQNNKQPIGYLNPVLYKLPANVFNDIGPVAAGVGAGATVLNSNEEYGTGIPGVATTTGWDLTTGFGSPKVAAFVAALAAAP